MGGPRRVPWWLGVRVRLPALLLVLGVVVWWALGVRGASSSALPPECSVPPFPPAPLAVKIDGLEMRQLYDSSGIALLHGSATLQRAGVIEPRRAAWLDDPPSSRMPDPFWAGYEVRWWAPGGGTRIAGVFEFRDPGAAWRFVLAVTDTHCRKNASSRNLERPPAARELVHEGWNGEQLDVWFTYERWAYWVAEQGPGAADARAELAEVACRFPAADCPP